MYLNLKCFGKLNAFALMRMNMTIAHDVNYIKSFHSGLQKKKKTELYDIVGVHALFHLCDYIVTTDSKDSLIDS